MATIANPAVTPVGTGPQARAWSPLKIAAVCMAVMAGAPGLLVVLLTWPLAVGSSGSSGGRRRRRGILPEQDIHQAGGGPGSTEFPSSGRSSGGGARIP